MPAEVPLAPVGTLLWPTTILPVEPTAMVIGELDEPSPSLCAKIPAEPCPVAWTVPLTATLMLPPVPVPPAAPMYAPPVLGPRPPPPPIDCKKSAVALAPDVLTAALSLIVSRTY